ncbi:MAG: 3-deoxy-7-phosphoheptulonate synthase, partial [Proteobacteria bacterium]|nr:3-deoxy-7-phosphoheptulonate synthase [Pseudomonadota bacterium]
MLKRGPSVTVEEWIMAAEYILHGGNMQVMMCERGI